MVVVVPDRHERADETTMLRRGVTMVRRSVHSPINWRLLLALGINAAVWVGVIDFAVRLL
jgi:hypothetical protein